MCPSDSYPTALELVASGRVDVKPLITHTYKLEETLQAFERAKAREGGTIKVQGEGGGREGGGRGEGTWNNNSLSQLNCARFYSHMNKCCLKPIVMWRTI